MYKTCLHWPYASSEPKWVSRPFSLEPVSGFWPSFGFVRDLKNLEFGGHRWARVDNVSADLRYVWPCWTMWVPGVGSGVLRVLRENNQISHFHGVPGACGKAHTYVIIIHSFTHVFNKDVLSAYYVPGPVSGPDDTELLWLTSWLWRWQQNR